jgi:hypothetical protein
MKNEKVPGCIAQLLFVRTQKKKQEDNFICRHLAPRVRFAQKQVVKNHPLLFSPCTFGAKAGRKRSDSALLDAFQPLGLEVLLLFQPTCLSASS